MKCELGCVRKRSCPDEIMLRANRLFSLLTVGIITVNFSYSSYVMSQVLSRDLNRLSNK